MGAANSKLAVVSLYAFALLSADASDVDAVAAAGGSWLYQLVELCIWGVALGFIYTKVRSVWGVIQNPPQPLVNERELLLAQVKDIELAGDKLRTICQLDSAAYREVSKSGTLVRRLLDAVRNLQQPSQRLIELFNADGAAPIADDESSSVESVGERSDLGYVPDASSKAKSKLPHNIAAKEKRRRRRLAADARRKQIRERDALSHSTSESSDDNSSALNNEGGPGSPLRIGSTSRSKPKKKQLSGRSMAAKLVAELERDMEEGDVSAEQETTEREEREDDSKEKTEGGEKEKEGEKDEEGEGEKLAKQGSLSDLKAALANISLDFDLSKLDVKSDDKPEDEEKEEEDGEDEGEGDKDSGSSSSSSSSEEEEDKKPKDNDEDGDGDEDEKQEDDEETPKDDNESLADLKASLSGLSLNFNFGSPDTTKKDDKEKEKEKDKETSPKVGGKKQGFTVMGKGFKGFDLSGLDEDLLSQWAAEDEKPAAEESTTKTAAETEDEEDEELKNWRNKTASTSEASPSTSVNSSTASSRNASRNSSRSSSRSSSRASSLRGGAEKLIFEGLDEIAEKWGLSPSSSPRSQRKRNSNNSENESGGSGRWRSIKAKKKNKQDSPTGEPDDSNEGKDDLDDLLANWKQRKQDGTNSNNKENVNDSSSQNSEPRREGRASQGLADLFGLPPMSTETEADSAVQTERMAGELLCDWAAREDVNARSARRTRKGQVNWGGAHSRKPPTAVMEDAHSGDYPFNGDKNQALFVVLDGHAGAKAALEARALIPQILAQQLDKHHEDNNQETANPDMHNVLLNTFKEVDGKLGHFDCEGCTATVVYVWQQQGRRYLQCANVGDSTAFILRGTETIMLSYDHKVTDDEERRRMIAEGADITMTATRIGGIAVSRALGDHFIKDNVKGLSGVPYISPVYCLGEDESALLVLASDGLWDVMSGAEAMKIAQARSSAKAMVSSLMSAALSDSRCTDNITIMAVRL